MEGRINITVKNDFHGTMASTMVKLISSPSGEEIRLSRREVRWLKDALCGSAECTCGGILGQRPGTAIDVEGGRGVWDVEKREDGGVSLLLL